MPSYVAAASGTGTTLALPTHSAGDVIVLAAWRNDNSTAPSLPGSGWTSITTVSSGSLSLRLGWKLCASASEVSGTWSNATYLSAVSFSGADGSDPIGFFGSGGSGTNSSLSVSAGTPERTDGTTSGILFMAHRTNGSFSGGPSGYTERHDTGYATPVTLGIWTDDTVASMPSATITGSASAFYRSYWVELNPLVAGKFRHYFTGR